MRIMPESPLNEFAMSPQARRQRTEILDAMQNLQSAVHLLCQRPGTDHADLKTRTVVAASQQSLAKLKSFVEQSLSHPTSL